jgi:YVTN family beta-propeller protein
MLGPFEVARDGQPLALGGVQQRGLLALLLLHRSEVLSTDRLVDELWGERTPATAHKTVQVYVWNLRRVLGDGVIVTQGRGYVLAAEADQVDVGRFEALVGEGRRALDEADPARASARLGAALALWRGAPLADFAYERFAQGEIARLEEARLAALEDRIEADLALGRHAALVGELESLVAANPLRERLRAQLMLALYRSGRQADALESYRQARRELIDQLGIEPGPPLRELQRAILAQDPALDSTRDRLTAARIGLRTPRRRGGRLIAAGAGVLLGAAIAAAAVALSASSGGSRVEPNSVVAIDPQTNNLADVVPVGSRPGAITYGSGSLWVANQDDQTVSRVDPTTLQTPPPIPVGDPPTALAAGAGRVWVATSDLNPFSTTVAVGRIDPQFNYLVPVVRIGNVVGGGPEAVAAQGDQVWAAPSTGLLTRIDPATDRVAGRLDPKASPSAIAIGDGAVWVADNEADNVTRVDPTGLLTPIAVGNGPSGIAVGDGGVWVADALDNALVRIDPNTPAVTNTIPVGSSPAGVAVGGGSVWVADSGDGTVSRVDPLKDKVVMTIPVGGSPQALTVADGRVWVTVDARTIGPTGTAAGGRTLRIGWPSGPGSMDPALAATTGSMQLLQATCLRLLNLPDKPAPAGLVPTPEAARSLPTPSADGTTYTFKIRHGFQFSPPSNEPVTAQTFKYSFERAFNPTLKDAWVADYSDIAGMSAFVAGRADHIAGIVARGDTLTIRLLEPRPDIVARLTAPPMCAVPSDTPFNREVNVIPSAGPYYVQSFTPGQAVVLVRNPNYHGSRPHHFERIEVAIGMSAGRAVAAVKAGATDYTTLAFGSPSPGAGLAGTVAAEASALAARYGLGSAAAARGRQQYFVNPALQLDYFVLNTHRPLFSDLRLRQAVNYAIDRRALAALGDGYQPLPEHPTDHYLPPGMPGYRNAHAYPLIPEPARARQLANGNGRTAVLYTCNLSPCREQAQIVKTDLAAIGLRVQINTFPLGTLFRLTKPGEPFDLAWIGWITDFPDPYGMLNETLENGSAIEPTFNDPTYQRKLAADARLSGPNRYLTYGNLDLDLARNAAPLVAFGNLSSHDFFSARVGCQTYNTYLGMDLAALCVRRNAHR